MITTLIIAGIVLAVAGCVLCFCLLRAPEGHETAQGFIFGHEFAPKGKVRRAPKSVRKPVAALSKDSYLALQPDSAR
jgi:hypothetical protein